jgi:hypothetical protein
MDGLRGGNDRWGTSRVRSEALSKVGPRPTEFVGTITGPGTMASETPKPFVTTRAPGGRLTATGSRTGAVVRAGKFVPTVFPTPTGPPGKVLPLSVGVLVTRSWAGVLDGGKRKTGWLRLGSTTVWAGAPPIVWRSKVRPTAPGGVAEIPPGLIGPLGVTVLAPGVTPAGVLSEVPTREFAEPARVPEGLTAPLELSMEVPPTAVPPTAPADPPTAPPAAPAPGPPAP